MKDSEENSLPFENPREKAIHDPRKFSGYYRNHVGWSCEDESNDLYFISVCHSFVIRMITNGQILSFAAFYVVSFYWNLY